jgi:hypothetical protein
MTIFNSYVTNYQRVATGPYFPVTYQIGNQTPKIMRYNHSGYLRGRRHDIMRFQRSISPPVSEKRPQVNLKFATKKYQRSSADKAMPWIKAEKIDNTVALDA